MQSNQLAELLVSYKAKKKLSRYWSKRSAVAIVLDKHASADASILMIKRAEHKGDPWSGHMAFPGGRCEAFDKNGLATAKREMHEEVGFDIDDAEHKPLKGEWLGRLSDVSTSRRVTPKAMVVTPYVFSVADKPILEENYEVAETVWIPLTYISDINNRSIHSIKFKQKTINLPCYRYDGKVIWGMSLSMIDEILRLSGVDVPKWKKL
tara:strand:+ start:230 stop:853 length:624 start_codon:yes stop_codon:yes gene_type:complete